MAQEEYQVKGGRARKGRDSTTGPKSMDDVKTFLLSQEGKTYMQALLSIGVKSVPRGLASDPSKGKGKDTKSSKGKGKGKGAKGDQGKNSNSPTPPDQNAAAPKSRGKGGAGHKTRASVSGGGDHASQSFYAGSSGPKRPTVIVKGTQGQQAMMLGPDGNSGVPIVFICHSPECHLCHFKQRKACMECDTPRDVGLEPTVYDPKVHKSYIAQRRITTMMVPKQLSDPRGHASSNTHSKQMSDPRGLATLSGAKANASSDSPPVFPPDWDEIDISSEGQDLDMQGTEVDPQAVAHAATL